MQRKIAVFTGTRAEYGLLYWLLRAIVNDPELELQLIVSGSHLSSQFGETWRDIEKDGFKIAAKVEMLLATDSATAIVKSMGIALLGFADTLQQLAPDVLVLLGDRTEALAIAQACLIMKIPIVHLHGGELTQGAYDDAIRHAITKMSSFHFVATEIYRQRVIQLGEDPNTVKNVGALGLEHVFRTPRYSFTEFIDSLNIPLKRPYFLLTYHPVTLEEEPAGPSLSALFKVLEELQGYHLLFTFPNADHGNSQLINLLQEYCENSKRAFLCRSLGTKKYWSAIAHAAAVIGNSSSGIIEVPALNIPTINIGKRQYGRLAADSVIHSAPTVEALRAAFSQALSQEFKEQCKKIINPYGHGSVSDQILPILKTQKFSLIKRFCDWKFTYE